MALHGTGSSPHTWDGWVEALTDEFRVVRLDMPGLGRALASRVEHSQFLTYDGVGHVPMEEAPEASAAAAVAFLSET